MFEKVNPSHPDKVADRMAGAIVDLCYTKSRNRWSNESSAKLDLSTSEGRKMAYLDIRAPFTQGGGLRRGCGSLHDTFSS